MTTTEHRHLIHTYGDLILVMANDGQVLGYEVEADGSLTPVSSSMAIALRSARETA